MVTREERFVGVWKRVRARWIVVFLLHSPSGFYAESGRPERIFECNARTTEFVFIWYGMLRRVNNTLRAQDGVHHQFGILETIRMVL